LAVLALLSQSTKVVALATENDKIVSGASKLNDVALIQQSSNMKGKDADVEDVTEVGISSLAKEKNKIVVS